MVTLIASYVVLLVRQFGLGGLSEFRIENSKLGSYPLFKGLPCFKRFDRGDCNNGCLIIPKWKEERKRKPASPRTKLICVGESFATGGNRTHSQRLPRQERYPP
jgi:hypothetical protein